ncbi:glycosyltransferase family 4 protein [Pseudooceanicola sp.]|uniref:glycosyltransferase family 4 protein n=1 Tax=Pseudooceanicola sp. TaxID=1914328 RepID=UPI0035C6C5A0
MLKVLILVEHYLPGYKSGGPARSIAQIADRLGEEIAFSILTTDRDIGDTAAYPDLQRDLWLEDGNTAIRYIPPASWGIRTLAAILRERPHDVLYLNSFLSPRTSIRPMLARALGLIPRTPVIIAPRGEFSPGALSIKPMKKAAFLHAARLTGLYRDVTWQASNAMEANDIRTRMGRQAQHVYMASDLSAPVAPTPPAFRPRPVGAPLRLLYLSRITPKKNLSFVLETLAGVDIPVDLTIVGPEEDAEYSARCRRLAAALPPHVSVTWTGAVPHDQVAAQMARHDLFFLPTWGENYGHAIFEAFSAGVPALLSDTTPWRDLRAAGIGYDLPLTDMDGFRAAIRFEAALTAEEAGQRRARVHAFARAIDADGAHVTANRDLFLRALRPQQ